MTLEHASARQIQAADPFASTWLSANAGSGKTKVLIDRVARLLLGGTEPQRILCLTYTKAAASEMQNRLFARLGGWAMLPEPDLRAQLRSLGAQAPDDPAALAAARRLFARAIEAPGGLKIQTIHSFCAGLLRRFPVEAGVPPDFRELDDRSARLLRDEIFEEMAAGAERPAVDALAGYVSDEKLHKFLEEICKHSDAFLSLQADSDLSAIFGLSVGEDEASLVAAVLGQDDCRMLRDLIPVLESSSSQDQKVARVLRDIDLERPDISTLAALEGPFLFGGSAANPHGPKIGSVPTKALAKGAAAPVIPDLNALMERVAWARSRRLALAALGKTRALHRFARAFVPLYEGRKARHGWLDFEDLISRSVRLLSDSGRAAWVLYRLDGGIDHILVDEAQDTSPLQWQVIERLTDEFTAGEGAQRTERTLFVVGDQKQSIYSFQGADLKVFRQTREQFTARFAGLGRPLVPLTLEHSFRSAEAVLRAVDLTFDERIATGLGGPMTHLSIRSAMPGRVDLWEPDPAPDKAEAPAWFDPAVPTGQDRPATALARRIAGYIRDIIDRGTRIEVKGTVRPVHEGDVLILVQRRSELFAEVIRACKAAGLAIAGADRLKLGGELAVKDLAALLAFLATPEDDLSLAAALRSPLFGLTEGQLYALAQPRGRDTYLWNALRVAPEHAAIVSVLTDLRDQSDFLRPYELLERMLTRHGGRGRLIARLGAEAEEGIDALLSQALAYEQTETPSLTGFLVWMETDEVEVKRRLEGDARAIRVMTVHGSKGLEAPIVILPDCGERKNTVNRQILLPDGRTPVWRTNKDETPDSLVQASEDVSERQAEERMRLLYVAMTRAQSWLIACAAEPVKDGSDSWLNLIRTGIARAGAVSAEADGSALDFGAGLRLQFGPWPAPEPAPSAPAMAQHASPLPAWTAVSAAVAESESALSPSDLGGAKALPGEAGLDEAAAKRRGTRIHALLEQLPSHPAEAWSDAAQGILAALQGEDIDSSEIETLLDEVRGSLTSVDLAPFVGPDTLAEVTLSARLDELGGRLVRGTIDRLRVTDDLVTAIDYKSNAEVPATPADVPEGILRQMGAYRAMLARVYPGRRIETAIFWTRSGTLMRLPDDIVSAALQRTPIP